MRVHRIVTRELLVEVLGEDLDVARLVHDLGRRVVLGVDPRDRLDDLGRAEQRALLAVHELRQQPVLVLDPELQEALVVPLLERGAGQGGGVPLHLGGVGLRVGHHDLLLVDLDRPVQVGLRVPLRLLGLLVELVELRLGALFVVPGELGRAVVGHLVVALFVVLADDAHHRLHVVDALAADQLEVGPQLFLVVIEGGHCAASFVIRHVGWWNWEHCLPGWNSNRMKSRRRRSAGRGCREGRSRAPTGG